MRLQRPKEGCVCEKKAHSVCSSVTNSIPVLVLGNKSDLPEALKIEELIDRLCALLPLNVFPFPTDQT